ncbi:MAG: transglutaminase-like cysteine peptidase [Desulfovibrio sp.]|nr:transglutaminase-like cysteine peptidase [Desulfovibrio sp.]
MALKSLPQWLTVISKNSAEPIFQPEKYFNKSTTWAQLRDRTSGKSSLQQLQVINEFWNKWKYIDDRANWGMADYWAYPAQFLKKSGDCEDYAIVKYFTLKELGFDPHLMRIVVLKNTFTGEGHAVLAVYMNNDVYILDNLSPVVLSHKRIGQYEPQYSVNEFQRWQHIPPKSN